MSESLRERDPEAMGSSSIAAGLVPSPSPHLQGQKSPGPVKFGPPPPPATALGSGTNVAERERASGSGMGGAIGPFSSKSSVKARPGSPVAKSGNGQSSRIGLSGPGRAGTPVGAERKGPFASPSGRSANGAVGGGYEGEEREKHRMLDDAKLLAGAGPLTPPTSHAGAPTSSPVVLSSPSKMSVPQMVDGP